MSSLFRKYRPQRFADVAEQEHVVKTLTQQIIQKSLAQVYMFSGPRGVGKTTIARLFAKALQCTGRAQGSAEACGTCPSCVYGAEGKMMDTIEIDAASQTGVDAVRENIIEGVRFGPSLGVYKIFIIDEVHMLSTASFNALLKTLEEPPQFAIFILATTELHKIPATVLSRCQRFAFTRIPVAAMVTRLQALAHAEGRVVEESVILRIARLSEGCLRDAESLLGQVFASSTGEVTESAAKTVLPDSSLALLNVLVELLAEGRVAEAAKAVQRASAEGASLRHVHDDFLAYLQAVVFAAWGENPGDAYDASTARTMRSAAERLGSRKSVALLDELLAARSRQAPALLPELPLQVAFFTWEQKNVSKHEREEVHVSLQPQPVVPPAPHVPPVIQAPQQEQEAAPRPTALPTPPPPSAPLADDQIREKWGRCIEKAKEAGAGYALMISGAQFAGREGEHTLVVAFPYQMHVDRMQDPKNSKILLDAVREICLLPEETRITFTKITQEDAVHEDVQNLLSAFGGSVV